MNCPACGKEMVEKKIGETIIDFCENGCKGVWFDNFELTRMDEVGEVDESLISDILNSEKDPANDGRDSIKCPKCNINLHEHRYRGGKVKIDECYSCGGIYLDSGELKEITEQFKSDSELKSFVSSVTNDSPYKPEFKAKRRSTSKLFNVVSNYFGR